MGEQNIKRGEKWSKARAEATFQNNHKTLEWLDSQKSIVDDIKEYEDSTKPKESETKSKGKK